MRSQPGQRPGAIGVVGDGAVAVVEGLGQQVRRQVRRQSGQRPGAAEVAGMAVAAVRAWASTAGCWSGGRCGASPVSARARSESSGMAVAAVRAWASTAAAGRGAGAGPVRSAPRRGRSHRGWRWRR